MATSWNKITENATKSYKTKTSKQSNKIKQKHSKAHPSAEKKQIHLKHETKEANNTNLPTV